MKTAPTCAELIMDCTWQGTTTKCLDFFSISPTDDGLCCTFNGAYYDDMELNLTSR